MPLSFKGKSFVETGKRKHLTSYPMGCDVSNLFYMLLYDAGLSERKFQKLVRSDVRHIYAMDICIFLHYGLDDHRYR